VVGIDEDGAPLPGEIIAGKYSVIRVLGRGGMGVVIEAQHLRLGQSVAIKLLLPSIRSMGEITARFEREARAIGRLKGPHVAHVSDVDTLPDGSPFMVMELLKGRELGVELEQLRRIPYREAVGYILQACAAMAEAHRQGIVHRDLKPSNLFLCAGDGGPTVKVLDFGISKLAGDVNASVTTTASAFGTPLYMSPEQVRSVKNVDARADLWSLGVVLYELISGEVPFNGPSATAILASILTETPVHLSKRCPDVPKGLADAVMTAIEKLPDARFRDVVEFAAAIAPFGPPRNDPRLAAIAVEIQNVPVGRSRRAGGPNLFVVVGVFVAVAAMAFGGVLWLNKSDQPPVVVPSAEPIVANSNAPRVSPSAQAATEEPPTTPASSSKVFPRSSSGPRSSASGGTSLPVQSPAPGPAPAPAPKTTATTDPKYL
jgi:eukaryotic-like serine/threonine-protein kinase